MKKFALLVSASLLVACSNEQAKAPVVKESADKRVSHRPVLYGHATIYPDNTIVDGKFSILGNSEPKGMLWRNELEGVNGEPAYKFKLENGRRIELSTAYVTESMAAEHDPKFIENLVKIEDTYRLAELGEYGDVITYHWSVKLPTKLHGQKGIISQWHGRPDKTLTRDPAGNLKYNTVEEMVALREQMDISSEIDRGVGYHKGTKDLNGWAVDSYQRPLGELSVHDDYLYLFFRNDPNRFSGTDKDSPVPKPGKYPVPYTKVGNGVTATVVWERHLDDIPVDEWMHMKMEVQYATYSKTEDKVIQPGYVKYWINDKLEAEWQGAIGKNDVFSPYFQHGIYTGNGFEVHHSGYRFYVNGEEWFGPTGKKQ